MVSVATKSRIVNTFQITLFCFLVYIDNSCSIGLGGQWSNGNLSYGISLVAGLLALSHFKADMVKKWWVYAVLAISLAGIASSRFWYYRIPGLFWGQACMLLASIGIWIIVVVLLFQERMLTGKLPLKKSDFSIKSKLILISSWILFFTLSMMGRDHSEPMWMMLFSFGALFLIPFSKEEIVRMFRNMGSGVILGFWMLQTVAFGFRPFDTLRYKGLYYNSNSFSLLCLVVILISLVKIVEVRTEITKRKALFYVLAAINFFLVFSIELYTIGRTAILIAVFDIMIVVAVVAWKERVKFKKVSIGLGIGLLCFSICFPVTYLGIRYFPTILKHPIWFVDEYFDEDIVYANDPADAENYTDFDEYAEAVLGRAALVIFDREAEPKTDATTKKDVKPLPRDPDEANKTYPLKEKYNAIDLRIAIAKVYVVDLNLLGHTAQESLRWASPTEFVQHAHNVWVQMLFSYGIPAGVCFIIWTLMYLFCSIKFLIHQKINWLGLIPILTWITLLGFGVADQMWRIGQLSWFVLMFCQLPLLRMDGKFQTKENPSEDKQEALG